MSKPVTPSPVPAKPGRSEPEVALLTHFQNHEELVREILRNLDAFGTPTKGFILTGNMEDLKARLLNLRFTLSAIVKQLDSEGSCIIKPKSI